MMGEVMIFAKAPVRGTVKTRLARDIGDDAALAVYVRMLHGVVARLSGGDWRLLLSVTPDESVGTDDLWPDGVVRIAQGGGDLGARMLRALAGARPEAPVIVVGSDIPGLGPGQVARAFAALRHKPLVFGPAKDGGFYLVGAAERPPAGLFDGITRSTGSVLANSVANAPTGAVALIEPLADLDDLASLAAHRAAGLL